MVGIRTQMFSGIVYLIKSVYEYNLHTREDKTNFMAYAASQRLSNNKPYFELNLSNFSCSNLFLLDLL